MTQNGIKVSLRLFGVLAAVSTLAVLLFLPRPAESLAPLGYSWSCASRYCSFYVTTTNHGAYQWAFGDGTLSSKTTSTSASHFYNTPIDEQSHNATVTLVGYARTT